MEINLIGELKIMDDLKIKPNYAELGRQYGMDWRTVKKYHNGYKGPATTRNKNSKLDNYKDEIKEKFTIKRITTQGVYKFMLKKYGIENIGSYSNFSKYVSKEKLKVKEKTSGHPRYEKEPGTQAQVDWKEDITLISKRNEKFIVNIFHIVLKFSRYSYLELTVQKRFDDVSRSLINGLISFGGVPDEILFDNMSTVANVNAKPKKPTEAILKLAKEFGFKVRLCQARSPETKGTVEAKNKVIDWIRAYNNEFETFDELIDIVENINRDMNVIVNQETNMSPVSLFFKEKEHLKPLPNKTIIDSLLCPNKYKVSNESLIKYGDNKYSVDPKLIGEEVTIDVLDNKLYIYYNGKLETLHEINKNPITYKNDHYRELMKNKTSQEKIEDTVKENLEIMDKLLENRKVFITEIEASKSEDGLITYLNQSQHGKGIINYYVNLSKDKQIKFIISMCKILPYVKNRENFINIVKTKIKDDLCGNIGYECWVHDYNKNEDEKILIKKGYNKIMEDYSDDINDYIKQLEKGDKENECI